MKRSKLLSCAKALLLLVSTLIPPLAHAQEKDLRPRELFGVTGEYTGRRSATTTVMPTYPEEALEKGVGAIVEVRVGVNEWGEMVKVKAPPDINPLFKKAVVDAVKRWKFKESFGTRGAGVIITFRLTFRFAIDSDGAHAELYIPPPGSKANKRMLEYDQRSFAEWEKWVDVTDN